VCWPHHSHLCTRLLGTTGDLAARVFDSLRPIDPQRAVFGQYEGYRDEVDVADDSRVETFAAVEVRVDTWRWSGVPFYLRTGKSMADDRRTVTIGITEAPLAYLSRPACRRVSASKRARARAI